MRTSLKRKLANRAMASADRDLEKRLAGLSRAGQVSRSTVPVGESDLPVVETLESAVDVIETLPGVVDTADQAGSDAYEAWDQSEFAKNLAEELGVNVGDLTDEVSAAASAAAAAQGAADAAQLEAETARSEATSKSAAAEAAAKAHADAEAEAARLAAVAAASGDATAKANAAEAAAKAAAAADASAKANAAEAAAKADAAAAQSTANDAASAAAAAQSAAGSAADLANQAQATASGKNKIYRSTAAPSGVGSAAGDKWERYDTLAAGGKLQGTWAWSGSAWVSTVLSETYLPLVNIGSGTYGTLAGARLAATAIDGMTITGALIRTAPSGQRLQLDVGGLKAFDAAGAVKASLSSADGALDLAGSLITRNGDVTSEYSTGRIASLRDGRVYLDPATIPGSEAYITATGFYGKSNSIFDFQGDGVGGSVAFTGVRISTNGNEGIELVAPNGRIAIRSVSGVSVSIGDSTAWANISVTGATAGFVRWRRYLGRTYLRFDVTLGTAIPSNGQAVVFNMPPAAGYPEFFTQLAVGSSGFFGIGGAVSSSGAVSIGNGTSSGRTRFWGNGDWEAV